MRDELTPQHLQPVKAESHIAQQAKQLDDVAESMTRQQRRDFDRWRKANERRQRRAERRGE